MFPHCLRCVSGPSPQVLPFISRQPSMPEWKAPHLHDVEEKGSWWSIVEQKPGSLPIVCMLVKFDHHRQFLRFYSPFRSFLRKRWRSLPTTTRPCDCGTSSVSSRPSGSFILSSVARAFLRSLAFFLPAKVFGMGWFCFLFLLIAFLFRCTVCN